MLQKIATFQISFFMPCLRKLIVVVVFIHCMNQFVHICKCVCMLYLLTFYTKASYINKNVYYTCTVFAIKDPPFLGEMLLSKAEISYNIQLNIENMQLTLATIYNKHFQSILCYQSISHICHKFRNFLLSEKKKKNECLFRNNVLNKILHYITEFTSYYSRKKPLASLTSLATTLNNFGARLETISAL